MKNYKLSEKIIADWSIELKDSKVLTPKECRTMELLVPIGSAKVISAFLLDMSIKHNISADNTIIIFEIKYILEQKINS